MLIIDFETRSRCDLLKHGAYTYAKHSSTTLLFCAFVELYGNREFLWTPQRRELPVWVLDLLEHRKLPKRYVMAHNAQFDRLIWEYVAAERFNFPDLSFERWYCTSAQCRVNGLPASLEDAGRALDSRHKKDSRGGYLIRQLSLPQEDGSFNDDPELLKEMGQYCLQDARTTKELVLSTRMLTESEHEDWLISEDINDAGVLVDVELAEISQHYAQEEYREFDEALSKASDGVITKHTQTKRAAQYVVDRLGVGHPALEHLAKYKDGQLKYSLDKNCRKNVLNADELGEFHLPTDVYNVILLMEESGESSVSKFKTMQLRADPVDHRVRGAFIYAGAQQTQRFSSRGLQLHNMPQRGGFKNIEEADEVYARLLKGQSLPGATMPLLKNMLRYAIKAAPGHKLVIGDWSGIEARVLPWLSDSPGGDEKLKLIASGADVYQLTADRVNMPERRDVGKVMELAFGYQGALGAFNQFSVGYGIEPMAEQHVLDLVWQWRDLNRWAVEFWDGLEAAARYAVASPGKASQCGRIQFIFFAELMKGSLIMILPGGTMLTYPHCRLNDAGQLVALKASQRMRADAKEWPSDQLYGGKLAGRATQGTAAALLRYLLSLKETELCIAHVHDEVILEVAEAEAEARCEALRRAMCLSPPWAGSLPLKAEPFISDRFRK